MTAAGFLLKINLHFSFSVLTEVPESHGIVVNLRHSSQLPAWMGWGWGKDHL